MALAGSARTGAPARGDASKPTTENPAEGRYWRSAEPMYPDAPMMATFDARMGESKNKRAAIISKYVRAIGRSHTRMLLGLLGNSM